MDSVSFINYIFLLMTTVTLCLGEQESEVVVVNQEPGKGARLFPNKYSIWFELGGKTVRFKLSRDDGLTRALNPPFGQSSVFLPDQLITYENKQEFAFYTNDEPADSPTKAGFVLHRPSADKPANIYGQFRRDGSLFVLQHVQDSQHSLYVLESTNGDKAVPVPGTTSIVEIFILSGPDVFRFHKQRLSLTKAETDVFLRVWEKSLIREVDLVFQTVSTVDIRLYYMGGGGDSNLREPWFDDSTNNEFMDASLALSGVTTYLTNLRTNGLVPQYDLAIVLTRRNLADSLTGDNSRILSTTDPSLLCSATGAVSIADIATPHWTKAIAQAIFTLFGLAYEDSSTFTALSLNNAVAIPRPNRKDRWTITQQRMRQLATAVDDNGACLLVQEPGFNYDDFLATPTFGGTYDDNQQCSVLYGSGSASCLDPLEVNMRVCYDGQTCQNPLSGLCELSILFADSLPCDTFDPDLACSYGSCVESGGSSTSSTSSTSPSPSPSTSTSSTQTPTPQPIVSTTTAEQICKCEDYPIGDVRIKTEYIPCS